jgi:hypothetical protein
VGILGLPRSTHEPMPVTMGLRLAMNKDHIRRSDAADKIPKEFPLEQILPKMDQGLPYSVTPETFACPPQVGVYFFISFLFGCLTLFTAVRSKIDNRV